MAINNKFYNYNKAIDMTADIITKKKKLQFKKRVMLVGVEGLSSSGKSLFSQKLVSKLNKLELESFFIEGDAFHQGKKKAMFIYKEVIKRIKIGNGIPKDFIQKIWREGI